VANDSTRGIQVSPRFNVSLLHPSKLAISIVMSNHQKRRKGPPERMKTDKKGSMLFRYRNGNYHNRRSLEEGRCRRRSG